MFYFFFFFLSLLMEWKKLSGKSRLESLPSFWYSFSTILLLSKNLNTFIIYKKTRPSKWQNDMFQVCKDPCNISVIWPLKDTTFLSNLASWHTLPRLHLRSPTETCRMAFGGEIVMCIPGLGGGGISDG